LDEAEQSARAIVKEHIDLLERVAQALLDRETLDAAEIGLLDVGEALPPLASGDEDTDDGSGESEGSPAEGGEPGADAADADLDELDAASVDEADSRTEVPTAVKLGHESAGDEETSPGTVRTPAVQLSTEDPEADASG
jgi:hypothetical protein